jgi:membrane protease YdiL (CAAX protease family)
MDENLPEVLDAPPAHRPPEPQVWTVLLTQLMLFILCAGIFQLTCMATDLDAARTLRPDAPTAARWMARLELGLGHFFAFAVSGFFTAWLFYRSATGTSRDWPDYLRARHLPRPNIALLAVLLMSVSIPLVLFALNINQLIPFPESVKAASEQTETMLRGLLKMENFGELLANLTVVALLPAIGEEIVFRGVVQQQLMRRIANPWVALTVSAAVFSFAHFQFEGFLPRLMLGFLLGWLFWKTQNFWIPALAHFFNNALQVVGQYLYGKEVSSLDLEKDIQVPWLAAAVSALMVVAAMWQIQISISEKKFPKE